MLENRQVAASQIDSNKASDEHRNSKQGLNKETQKLNMNSSVNQKYINQFD